MLHSKLSAESSSGEGFSRSIPGRSILRYLPYGAGGWGQRVLCTGGGELQLKMMLSLTAGKLPREKIASDKGFGCVIWVGLFRHKIWEQIQSSVTHPRAKVPSAPCSYFPPRENLQAWREGIHILWGLTPGIWLSIIPVCFVCVPLEPPFLTCAPHRGCEVTLLPVSLVSSSAVGLNLYKSMSDWRDAFMNCVTLIWSRSPLKGLQTGAFQMVWMPLLAKQMAKKFFQTRYHERNNIWDSTSS